jgi:putative membrane protein
VPRFQLHPEVWVLVAALVAMAVYAVRVIGPKVVPAGEPVVTRRQIGWFAAGVAVLWLASEWPMHDVAEERLYSVHMVQHVLLSYAVPPMFLLAMPTWLARLVVGEGRWLRHLCHPVAAGVLFNVVTVFLHWQNVVNASVENGAVHYGLHLLLVFASLLMWMPVCGPVPELRLSLPGQMIYLFAMSIVPTVPAGWLTFAEGAVYSAYDIPERLWGLSVTSDQQLAGLVMKLVAGFYLWGLIVVLFVKWAKANMEADRAGRSLRDRQILTWDEVERELTQAP